jgi:hypothetical protein
MLRTARASPSLKFGFPLTDTVSNFLTVRNCVRLTALSGFALTEMIFTARLLSAHAISDVVDGADLHREAKCVAEEVEALSGSMRSTIATCYKPATNPRILVKVSRH